MKITGVQYYWIIFLGLLFGLLGAVLAGLNETIINSSNLLVILVLLLSIFPGICYFVVILEIWSRIRWWLFVVIFAATLAAKIVHPVFLLIYSLGPLVYWLSRIKGVPSVDNNKQIRGRTD